MFEPITEIGSFLGALAIVWLVGGALRRSYQKFEAEERRKEHEAQDVAWQEGWAAHAQFVKHTENAFRAPPVDEAHRIPAGGRRKK